MSISDTSLPGSDALRIFISYSRADTDAADALFDALKARGFSVKIDRRDLPYGEKWQEQLSGFIAASDTVIFLLSPDSIQSKWCRWELEEVSRLSKRLFVIRVRDTGAAELPASIAAVQILPQAGLYSQRDYENTLVGALNTDSAWLRKGSTLADDAREWLGHERDSAMLLRGRALIEAESWVKRKPHAAPAPHADVLDLIGTSRSRRKTVIRRLTYGVAATFAAASIGYAGYRYDQWYRFERIETAYCRNYAEEWALPVCIGKMTPEELPGRATYYEIDRQADRVVEMRRLNASRALIDSTGYPFGQLTTEIWDRGVAKWVYPRPEGSGLRIVQFGKGGLELRTMELSFQPSNGANRLARVEYKTKQGVIERPAAEGTSLGNLDPDTSRRSSIGQHILTFDAKGRLERRAFQVSGGGSPASDPSGTFGRRYEYDGAGHVTKVTAVDSAGSPVADGSGIQSHVRGYDDSGELRRIEFRDRNDKLALSENNVAGMTLENDAHGKLEWLRYFGVDELPAIYLKEGVAGFQYLYGGNAELQETRSFGRKGEPLPYMPWGVEVSRWTYNDKGDRVEAAYFDGSGQAALRRDLGVHRIKWSYDTNRRIDETEYFGLDGEKAVRADWNIAREKWTYGDTGAPTSAAFFGTDGALALRKDWNAASATWEVDEERGQTTRAEFRDRDGQLTLRRSGQFAWGMWDYNGEGNQRSVRYFGPDGKPIPLDNRGAAEIRYGHDAAGNRTDEEYFDGAVPPARVTSTESGVFHVKWGYANRRESTSYLDAEGDPMPRKGSGHARVWREYDERGGLIREVFEDELRRPTLNRDIGAHIIRRTRDSARRETKREFLDTKEKPIAAKDWGVAAVATAYDDERNVVTETYLDVEGKAASRRDTGIAGVRRTNDRFGREVSRAFFDAGGKPAATFDWGVARVDSAYDVTGNLLSERYFDDAGLPTLRSDTGVGGIDWMYGPFGRTAERYVGADGKPTVDRRRVSEVRWDFNELGFVVKEAYFDRAGHPTENARNGAAALLYKRDPFGRISSERQVGLDGASTAREGRAAETRWSYDPRGNTIERRYFDAAENPFAPDPEQVAAWLWKYDEFDRWIEQRYLDVSGKETVRGGVDSDLATALLKTQYDKFGNRSTQNYFDIAGNAALAGEVGYASIHRTFDEMNRLVAYEFLDASGKPMNGGTGGLERAKTEIAYDVFGRTRELRLFALVDLGQGNIELLPGMTLTRSHDALGRLASISVITMDGTTPQEYALLPQVRYSYDSRHLLNGVSFHDADGSPLPYYEDVVRVAYVCDQRGNLSEERFFGSDGPLKAPGKPALIKRAFEDDREVSMEAFDHEGRPIGMQDMEEWYFSLDFSFPDESRKAACSRAGW